MSSSADLYNIPSSPCQSPRPGQKKGRRTRERGKVFWYQKKGAKGIVGLICLVGLFFVFNGFMVFRLQADDEISGKKDVPFRNSSSISVSIKGESKTIGKGKRLRKGTYDRMLALAAHALAENKREPKDLWQELFVPASAWRPCADRRNWNPSEGNNGYILVTANGGINQQRVAVCNAVVIARLLNSTLVIPRFMYSSVWRDVSDIYQEEHFINYLTPDIPIVKELPKELQSLDLEAIGSVVTDADIGKESKPSFYLKNILPVLLKNRVVHFVGFGNRLAFDPIPFQLQTLRCRCNFHALQFAPRIQETGSLLIQRLRKNAARPGPLDHYLIGPYAENNLQEKVGHAVKASRYLALHLRFEIDMVAHSLCEYGGGEEERKELEAYREIHFPALTLLKKTTKLPSPAMLREEVLCPLTPEEAVLMLAALGFGRKTHIFIAGANIYGGRSRLTALTNLYPNLVTKEKLLSATELKPFMNFSSQIQETGSLLIQRLRKNAARPGPLDHYLIGPYAENNLQEKVGHAVKASRYLALHLRFEIDMVAHSLCEYGGGEEERKELEAYREIHFPALTLLKKTTKLPSPAMLREEVLCPLTPEEAVLMLAALGFGRKTHIFIAGANIYGGRSRLTALTNLYPNLVTKEKLLSATELKPFMNFSSQLAALDYIACTTSDAFAMTDSGSQLSCLVSGFRIYYGGGKMPTIRPNKRRLADIFRKNNTIEWKIFEQRVRKTVRQTKHVLQRPKARSVYRYPRCKECMCLTE